MKKILLLSLTIFLLQATNTTGQITLDTILDVQMGYDFFPTQISETETKYVRCDTLTNTFSLYNMDFTPFLTNISVPEPFGLFEFQVMYITRDLFDCDTSNIEFAYGGTSTPYLSYYIWRTDGTQLFQIDSAFGPYCLGACQGMSDYTRPIRNTSAGAKLFLYKQPSGPYHIYSLCGTLPTTGLDLTPTSQTFMRVFPNPTSGSMTFQINPPDNINQYDLVIVDIGGQEITRQKVIPSDNEYTIDFSDLSAGTYIYSLCTKNKAYQTGKFIVTK